MLPQVGSVAIHIFGVPFVLSLSKYAKGYLKAKR